MEVEYSMDMKEKDILAKISKLKKEVNDPESELAPLEAQAILDEISDLEFMLAEMRKDEMRITPVINAPTVGDRPKGRRNNRMGNSRLFI